jgi:hypothetical protein
MGPGQPDGQQEITRAHGYLIPYIYVRFFFLLILYFYLSHISNFGKKIDLVHRLTPSKHNVRDTSDPNQADK